MKKVIYRDEGVSGGRWCALELSLENGRLSITGMEGVLRRKASNADVVRRENGLAYILESCGQIRETLSKWFPEVGPYLQYHLNDMRPGCQHQRAEGWDKRPIDPSKPLNAYGNHFPGHSGGWNMLVWVRRDEHPEGLLNHPCPTCGYRYGASWLKEELPAEVVQWVESFNG
jgi:hypothetical protein